MCGDIRPGRDLPGSCFGPHSANQEASDDFGFSGQAGAASSLHC